MQIAVSIVILRLVGARRLRGKDGFRDCGGRTAFVFVVYCELLLAGWDSVDSEFEWIWRGIVQNCISHLRLYCLPSERRLIKIHTVWHDPSRESGRDAVFF